MKKHNEIEFNADELIAGLESFVDHLQGKKKLTLRVTTVQLPKPAPELKPAQIKTIREKLNVSQPVFAAMLNIPTVTAISWEKGIRKPTGAALRLLDIVKKNPKLLSA